MGACVLGCRAFIVCSPVGASSSPTARSINLALSHRGIELLDQLGLKEQVLENVIPMRCRAMHAFDGSLTFQPYGRADQHINSVSRSLLNFILLNEAEKMDSVTVSFQTKLLRVTREGTITVLDLTSNTQRTIQTRLVIGADGAFSAVRSSMMRLMRVDFSQHFVEHGYKELTMPPVQKDDGTYDFAMPKVEALHIWPRHEYMMIALPNPDKTFVVGVVGVVCSGATLRPGAWVAGTPVPCLRRSASWSDWTTTQTRSQSSSTRSSRMPSPSSPILWTSSRRTQLVREAAIRTHHSFVRVVVARLTEPPWCHVSRRRPCHCPRGALAL